jgi:L-lactate utilization protein LutC
VESVTTAFQAQAVGVGVAVRRVPAAEAPARAAELLRQQGCRTVAVAAVLPDRAAFLDALTSAGLSEVPLAALSPTRRADVGISIANLGVAETGSVLLHSTAEDRRVELCVDVQLVLLDTTALVPTLDPAFRTLRAISARPPAYATCRSTGPTSHLLDYATRRDGVPD